MFNPNSSQTVNLSPETNIQTNVVKMLRGRPSLFASPVSRTVASVASVKDAVTAAELLVEEAQDRASKPWYRRLPKDIK